MVTDFDSSMFWGNFSKSNSNILLAKGPVGCSWNELENWVDQKTNSGSIFPQYLQYENKFYINI